LGAPEAVILYNGASGGLGSYLAAAAEAYGEPPQILGNRLADQVGLKRELEELRPSSRVTFIHLAALVSVSACEADPVAARKTNVSLARATTDAVVEWAGRRNIDLRVIYVSTGHVYAAPSRGLRLSEGEQTLPRSVYARTKLEAESKLSMLCSAKGVPLAIARVFGLVAPRQAAHYVLPGLIERVRRRNLAAIPGLDFARDYLDARDVCGDLMLLDSVKWPTERIVVNICSGIPVTIRDLLRMVIGVLQPSLPDTLADEVAQAPGRPDDIPWLVGNPDLFIRLTGESPQRIPLRKSVADAVAIHSDGNEPSG